MADKVKPLKAPVSDPFDTEVNPSVDYLAAKGLALENSDDHRIEKVGNDAGWHDPASGQKAFRKLRSYDMSFASDQRSYARTANTTFTVIAQFVFRGTNEQSTPASIEAILYTSTAGITGEYRLYNATAGQVIATISFTNTTPQIHTVVGSNWPSGQSILEVQMRKAGGGGSSEVRISAMEISW